MGWATLHIEKLRQGEPVSFRPTGHSMRGKVNSGQLVTVEPLSEDTSPKKGDIVLCKVRGREYLHLVKAVRKGQFLIGNNKGRTNGWTTAAHIYGICTKVES